MKLSSLYLLFALTLAACSREPAPPGATTSSRPPTAAEPTEHDLRGEILEIDAAREILIVHHEEIPGYMPAMTMEFTLGGGVRTDTFRKGQRIAARFVHEKPGELRLDSVRLLDPQKEAELAAAALALRQDTHARGRGAYREIGETAPSFSLLNQDGNVVRFDHFRGKRVVLNFIFTRCPIATMCPAATGKMQAIQLAAKQAGITDLELISISFDSEYDTPPVLKAYAAARSIDTRNFSFLTGSKEAIADLLRQFGVYAIPGENVFRHTLATILIGPDGRLVHRTDNSDWQPDEFLERMRRPTP